MSERRYVQWRMRRAWLREEAIKTENHLLESLIFFSLWLMKKCEELVHKRKVCCQSALSKATKIVRQPCQFPKHEANVDECDLKLKCELKAFCYTKEIFTGCQYSQTGLQTNASVCIKTNISGCWFNSLLQKPHRTFQNAFETFIADVGYHRCGIRNCCRQR
jgi:hypothetical protein